MVIYTFNDLCLVDDAISAKDIDNVAICDVITAEEINDVIVSTGGVGYTEDLFIILVHASDANLENDVNELIIDFGKTIENNSTFNYLCAVELILVKNTAD